MDAPKRLPTGTLPEVIPPYLASLIAKTGGADGPVGRQFAFRQRPDPCTGETDPLEEDAYEVAPGLLYKYKGTVDANGAVVSYGRVLWTVTRFCGAYCRFCTRGREVGLPPSMNRTDGPTIARRPFLTPDDVAAAVSFIKGKPEIDEVIVSGGDPLATPSPYFDMLMRTAAGLVHDGNVSIVRIATRFPVTNPPAVSDAHIRAIARIPIPYVMVHINHPAELTPESVGVLTRLRKETGAIVMAQTVLLKGVNDDVQTLVDLFHTMVVHGIRPYYVFQCEPLWWASDFIVDPSRAVELWQHVRPRLSGLAATAKFAIDVPHGVGKVVVPEGGSWDVDTGHYRDFEGATHVLSGTKSRNLRIDNCVR